MSSNSGPSPLQQDETIPVFDKSRQHQSSSNKRGKISCTVCRRGKNKCIGWESPPCQKCQQTNQVCLFEKPAKDAGLGESMERISALERSVTGMQQTLAQLVDVFQASSSTGSSIPLPPSLNPSHAPLPPWYTDQSPTTPQTFPPGASTAQPTRAGIAWDTNTGKPLAEDNSVLLSNPTSIPAPASVPPFHAQRQGNDRPNKRTRISGPGTDAESAIQPDHAGYPPLPPYPAPPHPLAQYGIVPSNASSEDEDASDLPSSSLTAPFDALAEAARAAISDEVPVSRGSRSHWRRRRVPPPRNAFPDVIEKRLVNENDARLLFSFYLSNCNRFVPLLDPAVETFNSFRSRTQFCLDAVLSVAARIQSYSCDDSHHSTNFKHASEEAHGIARSTLFAATVRIEAVMAVTVLSLWNSNPYLPLAHGARMALELNLHISLDKLNDTARTRTEAEERELIISARVWLVIVSSHYSVCSSRGRPHLLPTPEADICQVFLKNPFSIPADIKIVADVDLVAIRSRSASRCAGAPIDEHLLGCSSLELDAWFVRWDAELAKHFGASDFERVSLKLQLHSAKIFIACLTLKGHTATDSERPLVLQAQQSAIEYLTLIVHSPSIKLSLKCAPNSNFVDAAFAALFSLKMAKMFTAGAQELTKLVGELAEILAGCPGGERYAWTTKIALERYSRSLNEVPVSQPESEACEPLMVGLPQVDFTNLYQYDDWTRLPNWIQDDNFRLEDLSLDPFQNLESLFLPPWVSDVSWSEAMAM